MKKLTPQTADTFECAECHNIYEKAWTDEEANNEAEGLWGVEKASINPGMVVVCDDCFVKITGVINV